MPKNYESFGIWHTKHQKQTIMRCVKCQKIMKHATLYSHLWHGTDQNDIWYLLVFIQLSLSSQLKYLFIFTFSHTFTASPSPLSQTFCSPFFLFALFSFHS